MMNGCLSVLKFRDYLGVRCSYDLWQVAACVDSHGDASAPECADSIRNLTLCKSNNNGPLSSFQ